MAEKLNTAAQTGDIDTLYTLLTSDPFLLESINEIPFSQTPLHIAALSKQPAFLLELINLKPSLLQKLNTDGYSPIHIAATEGHAQMVKELLNFDQELGLLKGREWRTPLHCAAISGRSEVIEKMLCTSTSEWLKALTVRKETVLHLALTYGQMEVFDMLLAGVKSKNADEILNWQDREGNTILHLAAYKKHFQIIEVLLGTGDVCEVMDVNMKNGQGLTALDMLKQQDMDEPSNVEMENKMRFLGAIAGGDIVTVVADNTSTDNYKQALAKKMFKGLPMEEWAKEIENSPSETLNALMVVSGLITTVTFQTILSPPGGFTDFDYKQQRWKFPVPKPLTRMAAENPIFFVLFSVMNSVGFLTSLAMITVLTRSFPLKALLRLAMLSMAVTYLCAIMYIEMSNATAVWIIALTMFSVLLVQWFHLKLRSLKKGNKFD